MSAGVKRLIALDERRDQQAQAETTLDPSRSRVTPFAALVPTAGDPTATEALARGLAEIIESWFEHFPENIFWDADFMAARLWALGDPQEITRRARRIADLARGFGRQTEIRFQYVHDFLYGYDWARWVARDPEEREHIGPFDRDFLAYLERRQAELLDLIATDDLKYPKLPNGKPRNPFGFSRRHEDERRLLRALAADSQVPVEAWRPDGRCAWDRPFARIREDKARALGLATRE